jgi:Na+-transporting NADH:ubiquinone oxidoreductase subunit NqrB
MDFISRDYTINNMKKLPGLLAKALIIACILAALITVFCWLVGWKTITHFCNGFFVIGLIMIVFGILGMLGSGDPMHDDAKVVFGLSIGDFGFFERTSRWVSHMAMSYDTNSLLIIPGLYLIGFAILIPVIIK